MTTVLKSENTELVELKNNSEIVACLDTGVYGNAPIRLLEYFDGLPYDSRFDFLRTLMVPYLFNLFEEKLLENKNPLNWFPEELEGALEFCKSYVSEHKWQRIFSKEDISSNSNRSEELKDRTGRHYGQLFKDFDHISYFEEAKSLLETRLNNNGIRIPNLVNSSILDQGCGGGRYTVAWKLLGAKNCTGIDYSEIGLQDARTRLKHAGISNVKYDKGSVLNMPYQDNSFDIVFSNGVLHHTNDWQKGIAEQLRVLKPGGLGWLYLIENPGGLFWDKIEILRAIMKNVNKDYARKVLKGFNIPHNRIFYMLDHVMVPINTRLKPNQIEDELLRNGAISIERLSRGVKFDRVELIHQEIPFAKEKFGIGENRYIFSKP